MWETLLPPTRVGCRPDRPGLVLGRRDHRPRPGAHARQPKSGPIQNDVPARAPVELHGSLERVVHRVDPPGLVQRDHLVVVEPRSPRRGRRSRPAGAALATGGRVFARADVDRASAQHERVAAIEGLGRPAQRELARQVQPQPAPPARSRARHSRLDQVGIGRVDGVADRLVEDPDGASHQGAAACSARTSSAAPSRPCALALAPSASVMPAAIKLSRTITEFPHRLEQVR